MGCRARSGVSTASLGCRWFFRTLPNVVEFEDDGRSSMQLFVGDDWSEEHHDVELMNSAGRRLSKARLPEGVVGIARLHAMVGEQLGDDVDESEVAIGIKTDRGPWVAALVAAGYTVFAVNPLQAARFRERSGVSGAKSDAADATCWPTWCAPIHTSCGRWPATAPKPRRSRSSPGRTRP